MTQSAGRKLHAETLAVLEGTAEERLAFLRRRRWIGYPAAKEVLSKLQTLLDTTDDSRPENLLLLAVTNNGKTSVVARFEELNPPVDDPHAHSIQRPVLRLDAPPSPDEERLYNHILNQLGAAYKISAKKDTKLFQIRSLLRKIGVRVLVLDEINNSLAGSQQQRQQMWNAIKGLSNELQRPIVLTGTFEAQMAMRDDRQLQNRFPPMVLPLWQFDDDFRRLLASFEQFLPLHKASGLSRRPLADLIHVMSEGTIGELKKLLVLACGEAISSGEECITEALLLRLPWTPPSLRDQQASASEHGLQVNIDYRQRLNELRQQGDPSAAG